MDSVLQLCPGCSEPISRQVSRCPHCDDILDWAPMDEAVHDILNQDTASPSPADYAESPWLAAYISGADLSGADLAGIDLIGKDLGAANLRGANMADALLNNANLSGADLSGANLFAADLSAADLCGADLRDTNLRHADLTGTLYNNATIWPLDIDPRTAGAINVADQSEP